MFIPDSDLISNDYYTHRFFVFCVRILNQIRGTITSTAGLLAIGVGDPSASPMLAIFTDEICSIVTSMLGLSLGAYFGSTFAATNAKQILFFNTIFSPLTGALTLVIMVFPQYFFIITLLQRTLNTTKSVFTSPASTSLHAHLNPNKNPQQRAMLNQINGNQDKLLRFVWLGAQFVCLSYLSEFSYESLIHFWIILTIIITILEFLKLHYISCPTITPNTMSLLLNQRTRSIEPSFLRGIEILPTYSTSLSNGWSLRFSDLAEVNMEGCTDSEAEKLFELHSKKSFILCPNFETKQIVCLLKHDATINNHVLAAWFAFNSLKAGPTTMTKFLRNIRSLKMEDATRWIADLNQRGFNTNHAMLMAGEWRVNEIDWPVCTQTKDSIEQVYRWKNGAFFRFMASPKKSLKETVQNITLSALVPAGYPNTVADEYMHYQLWDTLQVACAQLRDIVTHQYILLSIGVGNPDITATSILQMDVYISLLQGVVMLLASRLVSSADSARNAKTWRVISTAQSFFNAFMSLLQGMYPILRLPIRSFQTIVNGVIDPQKGGYEQATILHLGNYSIVPSFLGDVAAKEGNQDRALGLCLLLARFFILKFVGMSAYRAITIVTLLSVGHIIFNAYAAQTLTLKSINAARFELLVTRYNKGKGITPNEIASLESVFRWSQDIHLHGTKIIFVSRKGGKDETTVFQESGAKCIYMKTGASPEDHLRALCKATGLDDDAFLQSLKKAGWDTSRILFNVPASKKKIE